MKRTCQLAENIPLVKRNTAFNVHLLMPQSKYIWKQMKIQRDAFTTVTIKLRESLFS